MKQDRLFYTLVQPVFLKCISKAASLQLLTTLINFHSNQETRSYQSLWLQSHAMNKNKNPRMTVLFLCSATLSLFSFCS